MIVDLINNVSLLLALSILYNFFLRNIDYTTLGGRVILGFIFGITSVAIMMNPFHYQPGVIFDGRSILASMAGLFGGIVPALITGAVASIYRLILGGTGAWTGVGVIFTSCILGVVFRRISLTKPKILTPIYIYIFGLIVHVFMILWMFTLPGPLALKVVSSISFPVMAIFPFATLLLGFLLLNANRQIEIEQTLKDNEQRLQTITQTTPLYLIEIDSERKITYANRPYPGYSDQEMVGIHFVDLFTGANRIEMKKSLDMVFSEEISQTLEFQIPDENDNRVYYHAEILPVNAKGKVSSAIFSALEITNRKNAEILIERKSRQLANLNAHIQNMIEKERGIIAREIHDDLAQMLTALKLDLGWLKKRLNDDQDQLSNKIEEMAVNLKNTVNSVKQLSYNLRPGILDELGLISTIKWYVDMIKKRSELKIDFSADPPDIKVDSTLGIHIYRIIQEVLTNAYRHSGATRIKVAIRLHSHDIILQITDNGRGISATEIDSDESYGIIGIRERVISQNGQFEIQGNKDRGTSIRILFPVESKI